MNVAAYLRDASQARTSLLARSSDLILALLIVAIVALMIMPLPRLMIDMLVAMNIVVGVLLVLMGIYVSTALQFSAFPSVLLISTLFRLALSVATTRMILLHGDAGSIIDTFGSMVAGGNLVVGLVVFLIITLVQFLVIAKGAERVAEVGARFTLDAMPGKQLSIDSDLRSGLIDKTEARSKRHELELESKLHGSMDGAMKFVKGDAIAGIVIICVNLLGGLAIGVFQLDMSTPSAIQKYSILTIGDGLVAQIPALLGAMAAGLIVTRSTDSTADKHLGDSIKKQFTAVPRVLLVAGGICILLAAVPGFPSIIFLILAVVLLGCGGMLTPKLRFPGQSVHSSSKALTLPKPGRNEIDNPVLKEVRQAVPLLLELPRNTVSEDQTVAFEAAAAKTVHAFELRSGVTLPALRFHWRIDDSTNWMLHVFEVPVVELPISSGFDVDAMLETIEKALSRHATLFLGIQESGQLLTAASADYPDIVKEVLRSIPAQNIATILRNLVDEQVSIRNLRGILEALVAAAQHEKDVNNLTEFARMALARQTCHRLAHSGCLRAMTLSAPLEERLLKSLRSTAGVQQLSLDHHYLERLRHELRTGIERDEPVAVLTNVQLRRHLRALVARDGIDTPVLSYNELIPTLQLDVVMQIEMDADVERVAAVAS